MCFFEGATMRTLPIGVAVFAMLAVSGMAQATPRFPQVIYSYLYSDYTVTPYQPPCAVCHERGSTGSGTAQTPFAISAKARGLQAGDNASLTSALDAMRRDGVDSDNDGIPDVQELEDNTDPNSPADVSLSDQAGPNSGCGGGNKANASGRHAPTTAAGLMLLPMLRRRKRKPLV